VATSLLAVSSRSLPHTRRVYVSVFSFVSIDQGWTDGWMDGCRCPDIYEIEITNAIRLSIYIDDSSAIRNSQLSHCAAFANIIGRLRIEICGNAGIRHERIENVQF
jgi:hypothetical protein